MYAETAGYNILANASGVYALVGGSTSPRVYLGQAKQGSAFPYVLIEPDGIQPSDQKPDSSASGQGASTLDVEDLIVFCVAQTLTDAQTLSKAVRAAMDKKTGATFNSIVVQSIQFLDSTYFNEGQDPFYHVYEDRYRFRIIR